MPKDFEEFQGKTENYSDFRKKTRVIDPNLNLNQVAYNEISSYFFYKRI